MPKDDKNKMVISSQKMAIFVLIVFLTTGIRKILYNRNIRSKGTVAQNL